MSLGFVLLLKAFGRWFKPTDTEIEVPEVIERHAGTVWPHVGSLPEPPPLPVARGASANRALWLAALFLSYSPRHAQYNQQDINSSSSGSA